MRYLILLVLISLLPVFNVAARTIDLATAERLTLGNQSAIKQRRELLKSREAEEQAANRERWARLDLKAGYTRLQDDPYEIFNGINVQVNDRDLYHYEIDLVQPLFSGFALSSRALIASLDADMARFDLQRVISDLRLEVRLRYLALLEAVERVRLATGEQEQIDSHLEQAQALFDQGLIPPNDLLKARVARAQADLHFHRAESGWRIAQSRLALLLGIPRDESLELANPAPVAQVVESTGELESQALLQRSELAIAARAIEKAQAGQKVARSSYYPQLNLVGSYQRDGNNLSASENPYRNNDNASLGLQLHWNLFSAGADRGHSRAADHRLLAAQETLHSLQDQILLEVESAYEKLELARQNSQTAELALEQARENHQLSTLQYKENLISTSELLDARTLLTRAEVDRETAHFDALRAGALLQHATAGWGLP